MLAIYKPHRCELSAKATEEEERKKIARKIPTPMGLKGEVNAD